VTKIRRAPDSVPIHRQRGEVMSTVPITAQLASDGLRQHMYAQSNAVSEACKGWGYSCWFSSECCNKFWCSWNFICEPV
jgi:hypothetical protein